MVEPLEARVLLSGGSISGTVWNDLNANGILDAGEPPLAGWTVYLDQNRNRQRDAGETSTTSSTDGTGTYAFTGLAAGTYYVADDLPPGWARTSPGPAGTVLGGAAAPAAARVRATGAAPALPVAPEYTGSPVTVAITGEPTGDPPPVGACDFQSTPLIRLDAVRADPRFAGIDGRGSAIAVLDTGIDVNHPMFGGDLDRNGVSDRIVYQYDFVNNDGDASDGHGHGSHVASIAAGSDLTMPGMAPGANLVALKVLDDAGNGSFATIERALQWVIANAAAYKIVAVNLSLGDKTNYNSPQQLYGISDELASLAAADVIVVAAAGNEYYRYQAAGVSYPAADPNVLAVGAVYDADVGTRAYTSGARDTTTAADRLTSFSQRSTSMVGVFAPGAVINGANATGGTTTYSGTSQAAPHVAGLAALAQQLAVRELGRKLSPAEFRCLLRDTATVVYDGEDEDDNVANTYADYPRVDAFRMADTIANMHDPYYPFGQAVVLAADQSAPAVDFGVVPRAGQAPAQPVLSAASDTGVSRTDSITKFDNSSTSRALELLVGGVSPGATVTLYNEGGTPIGECISTASVARVFTNGGLDLTDGAHTITARQSVPTLPASDASDPLAVTVDTVAPPVPPGPDLQPAQDTGVSDADNVTSSTTLVFTLPALAYSRLYRDGLSLTSGVNASTYYWCTIAGNGTYDFTIGSLDVAGNETLSAPLTVTIDTIPGVPGGNPAPGTPDPTFGTHGVAIGTRPSREWISDLAVQEDAIIAGGSTTDPSDGDSTFAVFRFHADGSPDLGFGQGGYASIALRDYGSCNAIAVQSDGKILAGGTATTLIGNIYYPYLLLARFNPDGTPDPTFGTNGIFTTTEFWQIKALAVRPDGKMLAACDGTDFWVVLVNADGSVDRSFGSNGSVVVPYAGTDYLQDMLLQSDGRILLAGYNSEVTQYARATLVRLMPDGTLDPSFDGDGRFVFTTDTTSQSTAAVMALQPDGKIVYGGACAAKTYSVVRLNPDGSLDQAFGSGGIAAYPSPNEGRPTDLAVQPDGRIVAAGGFNFNRSGGCGRGAVVRFTADGSLDQTFGAGGAVTAVFSGIRTDYGGLDADRFDAVALLPDGRILAAGQRVLHLDPDPNIYSTSLAIARYAGGTFVLPGLDLMAADDTGLLDTDNVTRVSTPTLVIPPLGDTYARIYRGGVLQGQLRAASFTATTQADGPADYTIRYMDTAGNQSAPGPALTVVVDTAAPALAVAVSRKVHGSAGTFDLVLSLTGSTRATGATIEPRKDGPTQLVFNFSEPIQAADGLLDVSEFLVANATFASASIAGSTLTLNLTNVLNTKYVTVSLQELSDLAGNALAEDSDVTVGALYGDIDQSGSVNLLDFQRVKLNLLQPLTASNFLADLDGSGSVNLLDFQVVKVNLLKGLS